MPIIMLPDRLARFLEPSFKLRDGKGNGVDGDIVDVCVLQAADWLAGGDGRNDHSENVCPVIGEFLRNLNDSHLFINHRCELKMLVPKILGTVASCAVMAKRANACAEFASRCADESVAESTRYAPESARYAAKSAKSARYADEYAGIAAESAGYAAEYAKSAAELAAEYAERAAERANCAIACAERTAELRKSCIECVESMIAITDVEV